MSVQLSNPIPIDQAGRAALSKSSSATPVLVNSKPTGFPSPCSDYAEASLDLNAYLVRHQSASFYFTVETEEMSQIGIYKGDKILVDRSIDAEAGHIVIAVIENEYLLKSLSLRDGLFQLHTNNLSLPMITIERDNDLLVWGVVTAIIRKLRV